MNLQTPVIYATHTNKIIKVYTFFEYFQPPPFQSSQREQTGSLGQLL